MSSLIPMAIPNSLKSSKFALRTVAAFFVVIAATACSKADLDNCVSAIDSKRAGADEIKANAQRCWTSAKRGAETSLAASREIASKISVNAPTVFFERQNGLNFNAGTTIPTTGVTFSISNESNAPFSKITYVLDIVGDGEIIASTEMTSQLMEMLMPGQNATVTSPVKVDGQVGDMRKLFTSNSLQARVRLTKAE